METVIAVENVDKIYGDSFQALKNVNLEIKRGEIFALLGPNGAGKTTLIGMICGLVNLTAGQIRVMGHNIVSEYRAARQHIGLVPQELTSNAFETVWNSVAFSRGLFGKPRDDKYLEEVLQSLSLLEKKKNQMMTLSGGMKRRVLIAKALSHQPDILFLDEPTAGVDVELRKSMWELVHRLRESGVTIILTTHYIEEAEDMADRVGVINNGEIMLVEEKSELMKKLGSKELRVELSEAVDGLPSQFDAFDLTLAKDKKSIVLKYDSKKMANAVPQFLGHLHESGIKYFDLHTKQSSLEQIFVELVSKK